MYCTYLPVARGCVLQCRVLGRYPTVPRSLRVLVLRAKALGVLARYPALDAVERHPKSSLRFVSVVVKRRAPSTCIGPITRPLTQRLSFTFVQAPPKRCLASPLRVATHGLERDQARVRNPHPTQGPIQTGRDPHNHETNGPELVPHINRWRWADGTGRQRWGIWILMMSQSS